ncbi:MAG: glycoside hydrolase family 52 protein [Clostridiaceae bacterium]
MNKKSYQAHHSSFGSYSSFILGKVGKGGGFSLSDVRSPKQNIYIGYKRNKINLLPFADLGFSDKLAEFGLESLDNKKLHSINVYAEDEINREMKWASDSFNAGDLKFKLYSPFGKVKDIEKLSDEEKKLLLAPGIIGEISLDNSNSSEEAEILFGMQLGENARLLSDNDEFSLLGGAADTRYGFACEKSSIVQENIDWMTFIGMSENNISGSNDQLLNKLGNEVVVKIKVNPCSKKTIHFALATYQDGNVTSGVKSKFAYTELFSDLEEALEFLLENKDYYINMSNIKDEELEKKDINEYRKFLIAHATHSYYANTELLLDSNNKYLWVANEGEYRMMNTFDLTVDHLHFEMEYHPWTMRNALDLFVNRYSYNVGVKDLQGKEHKGGISFTHDMGVGNMFSPKSYSSYERSNLSGCFGYMTAEQLVNWVLCASVYALNAKSYDDSNSEVGDIAWVKDNMDVFDQCYDSLLNRDSNDAGIIDLDSMRCGTGAEITTYDSLDISLGQARNNLYLAVKTWSAYVCMENLYNKIGNEEKAKEMNKKALNLCDTLVGKFDEVEKYIPAVFEKGNESKIIPAIEGLVFPYVIGDIDAVSSTGRYSKLVKILKQHLETILVKGTCIDEISGGWKLSSTSTNTWMSKIFICQFVSESILKMDFTKEDIAGWDEVHATWQTGPCSEQCATDQVNSQTGKDLGSRLYPRLVTNILFLL